MKSKILFISVIILSIAAFGTTYLAINAYNGYDINKQEIKKNINTIPTTVQIDENEVSPQMKDAIHTISSNTNEYALFIKEQDIKRLPTSSNKQGVLQQLDEYRNNISGTSLDTITKADEELYEVMSNYKYNAVKCIDHMIAFITNGNVGQLEMHKKYTEDLLVYVRQSKVLASKYHLD